MDERPRGERPPESDPATGSASTPPRLLAELQQLGRAVKHLFGAQWTLFVAELALARGAVSLLFAAGLAATVAGVGLGLTVLALIGLALAQWCGSWLWALAALAALQGLFLAGAVALFRRGLHWLTLPATRGEFGAMIRDAASKAKAPMPPPGTPSAARAERADHHGDGQGTP
jgi:hypothetical protein